MTTTIGALFIGLIGPFGSYIGVPLSERLFFQLACVWLGTVVFGLAARLVWAKLKKDATRWAGLILMVIAVNLPFSFITHMLAGALWPFASRIGGLEWYWQGLLTAEPLVLVMALLITRENRTIPRSDEPTVEHTPEFLGMPAAEVLCLQMEDHYVRVHGMVRSHLALGTLGQAINLLDGYAGLQIHRSWWIAKRAVKGVQRDGRNLRLSLCNGIIAPVSRSFVPHVRAAGLLHAENEAVI